MNLTSTHIFDTPIIPVIVINQVDDALYLADALLNAGITTLEITLRTPVALQAINKIATSMPEILVGAGTVINSHQYDECITEGAKFTISPGSSLTLLQHCQNKLIPLIPGVATPSEMITALELGYDHLKFFPAEANGGVKILKAVSTVLPQLKFCPTGGINLNNIKEYLKLPNVSTVGGSWILPNEVIQAKEWKKITQLTRETINLIHKIHSEI